MFTLCNALSSFAVFLSQDLNLVTKKHDDPSVLKYSAFYTTQVTNCVRIIATDLTVEYNSFSLTIFPTCKKTLNLILPFCEV